MSHITLENDTKYIQIVSLGVQFNSPEERYRIGAQIVCDRCQSTPIFQGYGLGNQDLCLPCADKVRKACGLPDINDRHTLMVQRQFNPPSEKLTYMVQRQFNPTSEKLTFMLQDQFVSRQEPFSITNMRQHQYNIRERTDGSDDEHITEPGEVCLFDEPIPAAAQHTDPQSIPDILDGTGLGHRNGNRDQLARRFKESIHITSQNTKPPNPETEPQWRTKMISEQYMQDCLTGRGRGRNNGDELARRLEEMKHLRDQPFPVASNMNDLPSFSMGGSSLDAQFGSLLTPGPPRVSIPKPPAQTPSLQTLPEESRYGNGSALTRMSQGMFRTRMEMGMYRKK